MNILAIDIGGSKLMVSLVASDFRSAELIGPTSHRTLSRDCSQDQLQTLLLDVIKELGPVSFDRIGVTIPGLADPKNGIWVYACFSGINRFPIAEFLSNNLDGKPVAIDNDVNACAWAEKKFGNCRDIDDFLWVTVSNGIGGGLVLGGEVYRGHFGCAAEIGHFSVVDEGGYRCGCGNTGCLEAEAAGPAIARRFRDQMQSIYEHQKEGLVLPSLQLSAEKIVDLAKTGDEIALNVVAKTGTLIGKALSCAVNLINLQKVVLGGGVMGSFDFLHPFMEQSFRSRIFRDANPTVHIEKTSLGYNAALLGAAALALDWNPDFGSPKKQNGTGLSVP